MAFTNKELPILFGMVARGDDNHDIAAWFGVNQGRVAEAKDGKYGMFPAAPAEQLPPKGPPGVKGRRLRRMTASALEKLKDDGDGAAAIAALHEALARYDQHED